FCAATGNTPGKTYELLAREYDCRPQLFSDMRVLKLDEWGGLPMTDPGTCEFYLQTRLLAPLQIPSQRYISFNSHASDPEFECRKIEEQVAKAGGIDCCVLGLGVNGHIGFNEPGGFLKTDCHIAELSKTTLKHSMVDVMSQQPTYGLTLGMANIFQARQVLLLVSGSSKKEIIREFLTKKVTPALPASFLWLHSNVICLLDKESV
ncbi:MAG TPA: galactosamine-6-phosphate isomerase, partial [Puia sp.]|nr:galactosamine-6-phosphate isomerase [Puia sp.]